MSQSISKKEALCAGLLCMGFAMAASAQNAGTAANTTGSSSTTSGAASASGGSAGMSGSNALSSADRTFAHKAAIGGMAEVELGNLAQQKASNDQVKQFGARMVQDHTKANDQLKQIASTKGVQLPTRLDSKHQKVMDRLQKMSGAQFDRAYMSDMVSDHKEDISDFKKEANSGRDSDLKNFASQTLPTLQEHLQMAQTTNTAVKKAGK